MVEYRVDWVEYLIREYFQALRVCNEAFINRLKGRLDLGFLQLAHINSVLYPENVRIDWLLAEPRVLVLREVELNRHVCAVIGCITVSLHLRNCGLFI